MNGTELHELATKALDVKFESDIGKVSLRVYLKALLTKLWTENEGFSGKRPFGNSGWDWDVHKGFVTAGLIEGTLDDDGCIVMCDHKLADTIVLAVIELL